VGVGSLVRVLVGQLHRRYDSSDRTLIPKDATHSQGPILDLPITLAKEKRTAEQTIALICQKLNEKSKIPLTVNADAGNVRWRCNRDGRRKGSASPSAAVAHPGSDGRSS
jgi:hypothetical protein